MHAIEEKYSRHPDSSAHIRIWNDLSSNASWTLGTTGIATYFEGTNVLVKVAGTEPESELKGKGTLFSAHYDSVSTAPGVTDDGMGVVTLLQLVEVLAERRGRRTAIFNFNNGEEDGLSGAHALVAIFYYYFIRKQSILQFPGTPMVKSC